MLRMNFGKMTKNLIYIIKTLVSIHMRRTIDGIRIGRAREAGISAKELTNRIKIGAEKFKNAH